MTSYFTGGDPQVLAGVLMQSGTRVRVGTARLYGSLETTSPAYIALNTPIGLTENSVDLGELASLGFEHVPSFEEPDVANVLQSSIQVLADEETTISIGVRQFDARVLELMIGTGTMVELGDARLIKVGGKCSTSRAPIEIFAQNIGCNAPVAETSVLTGITAIVVTAYDCQCTSGLPWGDIVAGELNTLDSEWTVYPVTSHALGNKLFNMFIY